ncbi:MAG TPA: HepT-like ribonuclease domain-containing protein [Chloroflexota bacterium]|nr:HepT-like ribonuclease domain-containing protein [Chloroflexota bacterium]
MTARDEAATVGGWNAVPLGGRAIAANRRIIAFRNILAHGYAQIDDRLVWDIVGSKLPLVMP